MHGKALEKLPFPSSHRLCGGFPVQPEYADGVHAVTAEQDGSLVILTAFQDTVGMHGRRALIRYARSLPTDRRVMAVKPLNDAIRKILTRNGFHRSMEYIDAHGETLETYVREPADWVAPPPRPVVLLMGPTAAGKSTLARCLVDALRGTYPDVAYIDVDAVIAEVQPVIYTDAPVVNAQSAIDLGNRVHDLVRAARPVILECWAPITDPAIALWLYGNGPRIYVHVTADDLTLGIRRAARMRDGLQPGRTDAPDLPPADLTVDTTSDPSPETVIHAIRASLEASIHGEVTP